MAASSSTVTTAKSTRRCRAPISAVGGGTGTATSTIPTTAPPWVTRTAENTVRALSGPSATRTRTGSADSDLSASWASVVG